MPTRRVEKTRRAQGSKGGRTRRRGQLYQHGGVYSPWRGQNIGWCSALRDWWLTFSTLGPTLTTTPCMAC
eukprot:8228706-Pyramimonas_sp.AAC.1